MVWFMKEKKHNYNKKMQYKYSLQPEVSSPHCIRIPGGYLERCTEGSGAGQHFSFLLEAVHLLPPCGLLPCHHWPLFIRFPVGEPSFGPVSLFYWRRGRDKSFPRNNSPTPGSLLLSWLIAPGSWLLAPGSWLLATGSLLVAGSWLLDPGYDCILY